MDGAAGGEDHGARAGAGLERRHLLDDVGLEPLERRPCKAPVLSIPVQRGRRASQRRREGSVGADVTTARHHEHASAYTSSCALAVSSQVNSAARAKPVLSPRLGVVQHVPDGRDQSSVEVGSKSRAASPTTSGSEARSSTRRDSRTPSPRAGAGRSPRTGSGRRARRRFGRARRAPRARPAQRAHALRHRPDVSREDELEARPLRRSCANASNSRSWFLCGYSRAGKSRKSRRGAPPGRKSSWSIPRWITRMRSAGTPSLSTIVSAAWCEIVIRTLLRRTASGIRAVGRRARRVRSTAGRNSCCRSRMLVTTGSVETLGSSPSAGSGRRRGRRGAGAAVLRGTSPRHRGDPSRHRAPARYSVGDLGGRPSTSAAIDERNTRYSWRPTRPSARTRSRA